MVYQIDSKNKWFFFSESFSEKFGLGFVLTQKYEEGGGGGRKNLENFQKRFRSPRNHRANYIMTS